MLLSEASKLALVGAGTFLLAGMACGIWKWRGMVTRPDHQAPFYVDTAHRAALMYSFACLVLGELARHSTLPAGVNLVATAMPIAFFAIAVLTYVLLALRGGTDNQFAHPTPGQHLGMLGLIASEMVGTAVLLFGVLRGP